jgi:hypothetical protein
VVVRIKRGLEAEMTRETQAFYQITIKGALDPDWSDWLNGFDICSEICPDGTWVTVITTELVDQATLRGVLNKIWDLNLELVSLHQRIEPSDSEYLDRPY